jgi:UDP:flavonoid glycosyltransferase YjiC (YdhE family)
VTIVRRRRVLFFAEAVTLAHVARPYALARKLPQAHFEVIFAAHPRFASLFEPVPWHSRALESISSADFLKALAAGKPVFDAETLERYAKEDGELIRDIDPDVVVGDFRISLSVSARQAGVPYVNITNGYWSPYARPEWLAPTLPITRYVGPTMATWLFRAARPFAFAAHARPMNALRATHALPKLASDVRYAYSDGDLTLYADLPGLVPLVSPPPSHWQMGPVEWAPAMEAPPWWESLPEGRSIVYVNLGSSGSSELLPRIIKALADQSLPTVVATTGRPLDVQGLHNVWSAPFLDGARLAERARLVICNGGSPSTQQALINGAPVLGLPSNLDQYLNMGYVQRAGLGVLCRADTASAASIGNACRRVINDPRFSQNAMLASRQAKPGVSHQKFQSALDAVTLP